MIYIKLKLQAFPASCFYLAFHSETKIICKFCQFISLFHMPKALFSLNLRIPKLPSELFMKPFFSPFLVKHDLLCLILIKHKIMEYCAWKCS